MCVHVCVQVQRSLSRRLVWGSFEEKLTFCCAVSEEDDGVCFCYVFVLFCVISENKESNLILDLI